MADAVDKALKRKRELLAELAEIEQFLKLHRRFSGESSSAYQQEVLGLGGVTGQELSSAIGLRPNVTLVRKGDSGQFVLRQRGRPAEFANMAATILKEHGDPMTRGALAREIEKRGAIIPSEDKERYIGTILWRQQRRFINFEGVGYWLRSEPYPPIGYEPDPDFDLDYDEPFPDEEDDD